MIPNADTSIGSAPDTSGMVKVHTGRDKNFWTQNILFITVSDGCFDASELDLLELELRAKAIKRMLARQLVESEKGV